MSVKVMDYQDDEFTKIMNTNLFSLTSATKSLYPLLKPSKGNSFYRLCGGNEPPEIWCTYGMTKSGDDPILKNIAVEWA
jgi:NAD(P)-dependent dehydrogenase (short-subunit alcohol dehydrogenase family)